jgi:hypothetical protein
MEREGSQQPATNKSTLILSSHLGPGRWEDNINMDVKQGVRMLGELKNRTFHFT